MTWCQFPLFPLRPLFQDLRSLLFLSHRCFEFCVHLIVDRSGVPKVIIFFLFSEITKDSSGSVSGPDFSDSEVESVPSGISSTSNISGMAGARPGVMGSKQPPPHQPPISPSPIPPQQQRDFVPVEIDPVTGRPKEPQTLIRPGRMNSSDAGVDAVESHERPKYGRDVDPRDGYRDAHPGDQGKGVEGPHRPDGASKDSPSDDRLTRPGSSRDATTPDPRRERHYPGDRDRRYDTQDHAKSSPYRDPHYDDGASDVGPRSKIRDDIPESELIDYEDEGEGESLPDGSEMEYDESTVRVFIALFDYDPMSQSPNPDAADEGLPFKEGDLIKVSFFRNVKLALSQQLYNRLERARVQCVRFLFAQESQCRSVPFPGFADLRREGCGWLLSRRICWTTRTRAWKHGVRGNSIQISQNQK